MLQFYVQTNKNVTICDTNVCVLQEQVDLLLEVQYRERLADVYDQVTKRLVGTLYKL